MVNWEDIHPNFTEELRKEWEEKGFNKEKCKGWIIIGLKPADSGYAFWLQDFKNLNPDWVFSYGYDQNLKGEYQKYLSKKWLRSELS